MNVLKIPNPKSQIPIKEQEQRARSNSSLSLIAHRYLSLGFGSWDLFWILSFVIGILFLPATLRAGQEFQPVKISASRMEADRYKRQIIYKGDVKVSQEDMVLSAETLTIKLGDDYRIRDASAQGNVHIRSGKRKAESERIIFDNQQRRVILLGNPRIYQNGYTVSGKKIIFYLGNDRRFFVEGGEKRVIVNLHK